MMKIKIVVPTVARRTKQNEESIFSQLALIRDAKLHFKRDSIIKIIHQLYLWKENNPYFNFNAKYTAIRKGIKLSRPYVITCVAYDNNIPIGCIIINAFYTNFYILEEYRNKGIASKMLIAISKKFNLGFSLINTGYSVSAKALRDKFKIGYKLSDLKKDNVFTIK